MLVATAAPSDEPPNPTTGWNASPWFRRQADKPAVTIRLIVITPADSPAFTSSLETRATATFSTASGRERYIARGFRSAPAPTLFPQ